MTERVTIRYHINPSARMKFSYRCFHRMSGCWSIAVTFNIQVKLGIFGLASVKVGFISFPMNLLVFLLDYIYKDFIYVFEHF